MAPLFEAARPAKRSGGRSGPPGGPASCRGPASESLCDGPCRAGGFGFPARSSLTRGRAEGVGPRDQQGARLL
eukprot:7199298-Pyramimonas_sp.AAC.1